MRSTRFRTGLKQATVVAAVLAGMMTSFASAAPMAAIAPGPRPAQAEPQSAAEPGSELRVYLMTIGQGDAIWEKFGHNAIWIRDESRGVDVAYNYGMFSFEQPGFVRKLLGGRMEYWMEGFDGVRLANYYQSSNRSVWLQELNLRPGQRAELARFLQWNAQPENRFYRYDYYRDNCSTRVRDALNRVMGGDLENQLRAIETGETYRTHTQRLTADQIPANTGLLLAMGHSVDAPITAWEEGFIPMRLMEHVKTVTVPGRAGPEPLVLSNTVVYEASRAPEHDHAPDRTIGYTLAGLAFGGLLLWLARMAGRSRLAQGGWFGLALIWSTAAGVFGTMIAMLWAFTDHADTYRNENVLQVGPLSLLLAGFLLFAIFGRGRRATRLLALAVAVLAGAGFLLQILPGLDQPNGEIIGLALPVHAALALSVARAMGEARTGAKG